MYTNKKIQRDNPDLNGKYPSADHFIPSNQRVQNGKLIKRPPSFSKIKGCSIENPTSLEMQGHLFSRKSESSGPKIFGSLCFGAKSSSVSPKTKYKVRELTSLSSHQSESSDFLVCSLFVIKSTHLVSQQPFLLGGRARSLQDSHCTAPGLHAMNMGIHGTLPYAASTFLSIALMASSAIPINLIPPFRIEKAVVTAKIHPKREVMIS